MGFLILTNNPLLKGEAKVSFVDGNYLDTLIKARDLVHKGHKLISSPLAASIRMMFSPYRSILLEEKTSNINQYYIDTIETSIITYKKHMEVREVDLVNEKDYAIIDKELLRGAIEEHEAMNNMEVENLEAWIKKN